MLLVILPLTSVCISILEKDSRMQTLLFGRVVRFEPFGRLRFGEFSLLLVEPYMDALCSLKLRFATNARNARTRAKNLLFGFQFFYTGECNLTGQS
jgi:hypothetical protein